MADYDADIPETVTVSESLTTVGAYVEPVPETVALSESDAVVAGFVAAPGETVTVSESEAELGAYVEPIGETVTGPGESEAVVAGFVVAPGETVTLTEDQQVDEGVEVFETVTGPSESFELGVGHAANGLPWRHVGLAAKSYSRDGAVLNTGFVQAGLVSVYYRMRAWNLNTADWELWTSEGAPSAEPPSGDPIAHLSIAEHWEA